MNFEMKKIAAALALAVVASGAQANANTFEFIGGGSIQNFGLTPPSGSWFSMLAMDTDEDEIADSNLYTAVRAFGTTGVPGPNGTLNFDVATAQIDRTWSFFNAPGYHFTSGPLTVTWDGVANTATVDMSTWTVFWNGGAIDMGAGAPAVINNMDGIWGNGNDVLSYSAIVPSGGFAGVAYGLNLVGSANLAPVPEASTYGMMLAGLGLVGFAVRRRKLMA